MYKCYQVKIKTNITKDQNLKSSIINLFFSRLKFYVAFIVCTLNVHYYSIIFLKFSFVIINIKYD